MTPDAKDLWLFAVKRGELEQRLDTAFNHPKYSIVISKLDSKLRIVDFGDVIDSIAGGATPLRTNQEQYTDAGIRFLRIQNITPFGINFSDVKYITQSVHDNLLKRSQLAENDLLMTITGRIGTCAVVTASCLPANINQHIVRIRLKNGTDPNFAAAYLNSSLGTMLSNRAVTGTTRIALDYESIKKIPFPILSASKQTALYVQHHNAVTAYLTKQQKVAKIQKTFESKVEHALGVHSGIKPPLCFAIKQTSIDGVIDAKRYSRIAAIESGLTISDYCEILNEKVNVSHYGEKIIDWIRIDDLPNFPLAIEKTRTQPANEVEGSFYEVQEGDILVARLGPTILNRKIVMVQSTQRTTIASAEFLVLRCNSGYEPKAVMAVLRTVYYRDLMYSQARGSTPSRYRLSRGDMLKLPFPDIKEHQKSLAAEADKMEEEVKILRKQAEREWQLAKEHFEKELLGF